MSASFFASMSSIAYNNRVPLKLKPKPPCPYMIVATKKKLAIFVVI